MNKYKKRIFFTLSFLFLSSACRDPFYLTKKHEPDRPRLVGIIENSGKYSAILILNGISSVVHKSDIFADYSIENITYENIILIKDNQSITLTYKT